MVIRRIDAADADERAESPLEMPGVSARSVNVAAKLIIVCAIVGLLFWAQAVIIPLALAMLLTFVLAPAVAALNRRHWRRTPAVLVVLGGVAAFLAGIVWVVGDQLVEFGNDMPEYRDTIKAKLHDIRHWYKGGPVEKVENTVKQVNRELDEEERAKKKKEAAARKQPTTSYPTVARFLRNAFGFSKATQRIQRGSPLSNGSADPTGDPSSGKTETAELDDSKPVPVEVRPGSSSMTSIMATAKPVLGPLATAGLIAVLVLFALLRYDELRNRLVTAVGRGNLALTMKALDDATTRISRFLLMQFVVNASFGIAVGLGLALLGVPYSLVWGLTAAVLRYIPFVGPWVAAALPIAISLITSNGWLQVTGVIGLFLVLELISNNIVEPMLYGRSIGVSEVGIVVSAAFWTWLWGPVGLLLSMPITVCIVVLGQHVRPLSVFYKLLGNEPLGEPAVDFFQRTMAGDLHDARAIVRRHSDEYSLASSYDEVICPALSLLRREHESGVLSRQDVVDFCDLTREIVESVACKIDSAQCKDEASSRDDAPTNARKCYGCVANDEIDSIGLVVLAALLRARGHTLQLLSGDLLASEVLESVEDGAVICLSTVGPDDSDHAKYLAKRLKAETPNTTLLVGCWGCDDSEIEADGLGEIADFVAERMTELENRTVGEIRVIRQPATSSQAELAAATK